MTIGGAIFLIAIGAILRYAVADSIEGIDLSVIGLILIIAGVAGALFGLALQLFKRRDGEGHSERVVQRSGEPSKREEVHESYE